MTTPSDIIIQALKKSGIIGVGQSAAAEDMNDAFQDLNDMIAQWARKRWLIWHLVEVSVISTGHQAYSIGPGGDFDVASRPDRLEAAFLRQVVQSQPSRVDYPLQLIQARETYNQIALKTLSSFPMYVFYDSAYPMGYVYAWPVPQASIYSLHLTIKAQLSQFTSLAQDIVMPPEYIAALKWNLAIRLAVSYKIPVDAGMVALAKDSLNVIRNANTQIPLLDMPPELVRRTIYNIYSDN